MCWKAGRDASMCPCPQCLLEHSPKICGIQILPGKLIQIPKVDTDPWGGKRGAARQCWQLIWAVLVQHLSLWGPALQSPTSPWGHKCP